MKCTRCSRRLHADAKSCLCGWTAEDVSRPALTVDYGALERERARMRRWEEAGSPSAAESIAKIKSFMRMPKPTARQHWEGVLRTPNAPHISKQYAKEALNRAFVERVPGEDDETFRRAGELVS